MEYSSLLEDLIDTSLFEINQDLVSSHIYNKIVLITGAAGSIGRELAIQIASYDYDKLILLDQSESGLYDLQQDLLLLDVKNFEVIIADINDKTRTSQIFANYKPDIIYHAAAYKHVPLMENMPHEALKVNVEGTITLMDLAIQNNVSKFVLISTDKAVEPTSVMGATKRLAEIYVNGLECNTKIIITRFGNVLESSGSILPLFDKQLRNGGPITITDKNVSRFFMTKIQAAQFVLESTAGRDDRATFIFDMGKSVKVMDIALKLIENFNKENSKEIEIKYIGLRPGEKLGEVFYHEDDIIFKTNNPKIYKVIPPKMSGYSLNKEIRIFCENASGMTSLQVVHQLKKLVPSYNNVNTEYI
ncbi:hypothetical protein KH5_00430 [Urechidicola sp. KH5]